MVVAAKDLKAGTVLKAEDLKTINWPVQKLPAGAHRNPQEVIGNTVFDPMAAEEPVLNARLATSAIRWRIGRSGGNAGCFSSLNGFDRRSGPAAERAEG